MENFAVDLDKVLDDFEFDEDNPNATPSTVQANINNQAFPQQTQDPGAVKGQPDGEYATSNTNQVQNRKNVYNSRYSLPYDTSDKFDMSGADFGPSPQRTSLVTSSTVNSHGYDGTSFKTNLTSCVGNDSGYGSQQFGFECNNGTVGSQTWNTGDACLSNGSRPVIVGPASTQGFINSNPALREETLSSNVEVTNSNASNGLSEARVNVSKGNISVNSAQQDLYGLPVYTLSNLPGVIVQNKGSADETVQTVTQSEEGSLEQIREHVAPNEVVNPVTSTANVEGPGSVADPQTQFVQSLDSFSTPQPDVTTVPLSDADVNSTRTCVGQVKVLQCCAHESPVHSMREEIVISEPKAISQDLVEDSERTPKLVTNDMKGATSGSSLGHVQIHENSASNNSVTGDTRPVRESVTGENDTLVTDHRSAGRQVTVVADVNMQVPRVDLEKSNTNDDDEVTNKENATRVSVTYGGELVADDIGTEKPSDGGSVTGSVEEGATLWAVGQDSAIAIEPYVTMQAGANEMEPSVMGQDSSATFEPSVTGQASAMVVEPSLTGQVRANADVQHATGQTNTTEAELNANVMLPSATLVSQTAVAVEPKTLEVASVVGFNDVSGEDNFDDAEMDSYLANVEISDKTERKMDLVSNSANSNKTDPQVQAEQDLNLNSSSPDKSYILPSPVVTSFKTQFSSDNNEEPAVIPPNDALPFLTETPTKGGSTPAMDPGFSRIPGLSDNISKSNVEKLPPTHGIATLDIHAPPSTVNNSGFNLPQTQALGMGARPKETSHAKASRPNSLIGLSKPSLPSIPSSCANSDVSLDVTVSDTSANALLGLSAVQSAMNSIEQPAVNSHDVRNQQIANETKSVIYKKQLNVDIKHQLEQEKRSPVSPVDADSGQNNLNLLTNTAGGKLHTNNFDSPMQAAGAECLPSPTSFSMRPARPNSFPAANAPSPQSKQKRPTSLNLPQRTNFNSEPADGEKGQSVETDSASPSRVDDDVMGVKTTTLPPNVVISSSPVQDGAMATSAPAVLVAEPSYPSPQPQPATIVSQLGKVAPIWVPDAEASNCMQCDSKFTFTRRRHHCRACGKVFCSNCCSLKSKLPYMDNKEARVCQLCHVSLIKALGRPWSVSLGEDAYPGSSVLRREGPARSPNPNNPSEYCSVISPMQQANPHAPPPTVMVPVGVLKREGTQRKGEPKSVMFSDGIRPGGDLTELDGSAEARPLMRKTGRMAKKVERTPTPVAPPEGAEGATPSTTASAPGSMTNTTTTTSPPKMRQVRLPEANRNVCLIPEAGLPPVILQTGVKGDYSIEEDPDPEQLLPKLKNDELSPVVFAVNKNLFVLVKILNLECCVNRVCWCFTTKGMCTVGQDEIVIVLEYLPEEKTVPRDIFSHLNTVYEEAGKGNTVSDLGHTIFGQSFLGSKDHGGFLYIRPTFQCLQKMILPQSPYVFGILLQKWETPWAKVFPIRLMLRLGAEYRYYPCPLISVRFRNSAFMEIGHTIMNLLADFRSYQYMLPQIKGVTIHMEDKITYINFPRNRYDEVMKVISNSNDHVMALGASFSTEADSHLVCIQNDDGNYQTQAINIQNKPRKVTGASFVVFNGALKTSSGLSAKSSIVEDGLMVQIAPESMLALKQALRDMKDYRIGCGSIDAPQPEEVVMVQWVEDDKNINIGLKSPIDQMSMDGVKSIRISNATDYVGETRTIRWTEVFFIQEDSGTSRCDPVDLSRLAETLNQAASVALIPHLDKLKEANLTKVGLRVTIDAEKVGYEIGSNGEKLPPTYMNDLDNELIPVIHNAASSSHDSPITLELIFHILE